MAQVVGIGVIGAGAIAQRGVLTHLSQDDVQDRVRLTAVCDPVEGRAASAAEKFGVTAAYLTFEEVLADSNVDAVSLCTPIGLHHRQGLMAIEAGKHIHFNKTMTTTVGEANEVIAAAERKGVKVVASPGMMLHPHNRRIRNHILNGDIGKLAWVAAGVSGVGGYHLNEAFRKGDDVMSNVDPTWYFRKPGGGPQYDVTVYVLHNLTGILGPARRVTAMSGLVVPEREFRDKTIACDMDDTTMLLIDFGNSEFAFISATVAGSMTRGFQPNFYGTEGSIVGTMFGEKDLKLEEDHEPHVTGPHAGLPESHVFEDLMQLTDWIRDDTPTIVTAEHARHVIDIIEAGYRASETGQTQELGTSFEALSAEAL